MGHIIEPTWEDDLKPDDLIPIQTGCIDCLAICPWTDATDPPLTRELGDLWYQAHRQICLAANYPNITWEQSA